MRLIEMRNMIGIENRFAIGEMIRYLSICAYKLIRFRYLESGGSI